MDRMEREEASSLMELQLHAFHRAFLLLRRSTAHFPVKWVERLDKKPSQKAHTSCWVRQYVVTGLPLGVGTLKHFPRTHIYPAYWQVNT